MYIGDKPDTRKQDINSRIWNIRLFETPLWMEQINLLKKRLEKVNHEAKRTDSRDFHESYHAVILETYEMCFEVMVEDIYEKHPEMDKVAVPLYAHLILADRISEGKFWDFVDTFLDAAEDKTLIEIFFSEN